MTAPTPHLQPTTPNRWLHRIALLTAILTFPLIFLGGLVTSNHAGMSVPDWPNSYGYNMFLFPPNRWVGGILYEHTHRLMGSVVGFVAIVLTIIGWKTEPRRWVRWLCTAVLGVVMLQGVLGGLRVVLVKLDLAIIHACLAQAFFCLATLAAIVTSKWWQNAPDLSQTANATLQRRLITIAIFCVMAVYLQLMIGATMRHYQAGLAIPDLPFAYGKLLPPMDNIELAAINQERAWHLNMDPVTLQQIWLHFAHRMGAIVVSLTILLVVLRILLYHRNRFDLIIPAWILSVLVIIQIGLGVLTVYLKKPADIASAHVAVGALVLVTSFIIAVRAIRLYSLRFRADGTGRESFMRSQRHSGLHTVPG